MINATYKKPFFTLSPSSEAYLGDLKSDGSVALTANWDVGAYTITALRFISDQATGTAPFTVASTTVVTNLNADQVDGIEGSALLKKDGSVALTADWNVGAFDLTANNLTAAPTLSAEALTNVAGWTAAGNWTYGAGAWSHTTGSATALTATGETAIVANTTYRIVVTNTTTTAGTGFYIRCGGKKSAAITSSGTNTFYAVAYNTDALSFTLGFGGTWVGSLDSISVKTVTDGILDASATTLNGDLTIGGDIYFPNNVRAISIEDIGIVFKNWANSAYANFYAGHVVANGNYYFSGLEPSLSRVSATQMASSGDIQSSPRLITSGTGTGLTVNDAGSLNRQVYKVTVTYAAFAAAALTGDKTIATLPAKTKIVGFYADTTTKFTGGSVSAASLTVGKSAGGVEYIATHDVFTAAIVRGLADADMGTELTRAAAIQGGALVNWTAATDVSARLTTVTANTNALTAGSVTFYIVTERY